MAGGEEAKRRRRMAASAAAAAAAAAATSAAKPELCLRWHSYEDSLLLSVHDMWDAGVMTDVTLSAEGRTVNAHQVVLSSSSGYFREILKDVLPTQHPIVVLPHARFRDLLVAVRFMYKGEVNVTQAELPGLLRMAELLRVEGLAKLDPTRASGLLRQAYRSRERVPEIKTEPRCSSPDVQPPVQITQLASDTGQDEDDNGDVYHHHNRRGHHRNQHMPSRNYQRDFEEERGPHSDTETGVDHGGDVDPLEEGNGNAGGGGGGGGGGRRGGGVGSGDSRGDGGGGGGNDSGSELSEGKLYFLTSLGQHEEQQHSSSQERKRSHHHQMAPSKKRKPAPSPPSSSTPSPAPSSMAPAASQVAAAKKRVRNRRNRASAATSSASDGTATNAAAGTGGAGGGGELLRALSAAWEKERSNGRATIRKTLLPVSCPVCLKVLSNAYNLKVHMSIHDGLNHQCSICGHTSKSRDALRKHLAYRHLIGQSGPVRPRMPTATKRRKLNPATGQMEDVDDNEDMLSTATSTTPVATPTPADAEAMNDLDAEILLQCEQVEDVDDDDLLEDVMEEDDEGEEDGEDSVVDEDC